RRFVMPVLDPILAEAAAIWPEALPWKWKPQSILDVGAYNGTIANQLSRLYHPDFIGLVEPQPDLAAQLQITLFAARQKLFACALGRSEGTATLNVLANRPSSSLLRVTPGCDKLFHRPMDLQRTIEVPIRTLDSVFAECGLEELDLLKIDVQGYELEVLAGGVSILRHTYLVVIEVSFFEHYYGQPLFPDIYSFLTSAGFGMHRMFGYAYDDRGCLLQCDAVFINLGKALDLNLHRPSPTEFPPPRANSAGFED
ncbi:FkbM family methyltransferase, partial [Patescibacteria group bacterium]|nr:FkbM family methyltransferase [Patescibacteria group bacterium]